MDRIRNISDTLDDLASLHNAGVSVLAFDYRGFGRSRFFHPSEAHMGEDAESALAISPQPGTSIRTRLFSTAVRSAQIWLLKSRQPIQSWPALCSNRLSTRR